MERLRNSGRILCLTRLSFTRESRISHTCKISKSHPLCLCKEAAWACVLSTHTRGRKPGVQNTDTGNRKLPLKTGRGRVQEGGEGRLQRGPSAFSSGAEDRSGDLLRMAGKTERLMRTPWKDTTGRVSEMGLLSLAQRKRCGGDFHAHSYQVLLYFGTRGRHVFPFLRQRQNHVTNCGQWIWAEVEHAGFKNQPRFFIIPPIHSWGVCHYSKPGPSLGIHKIIINLRKDCAGKEKKSQFTSGLSNEKNVHDQNNPDAKRWSV